MRDDWMDPASRFITSLMWAWDYKATGWKVIPRTNWIPEGDEEERYRKRFTDNEKVCKEAAEWFETLQRNSHIETWGIDSELNCE